MSNSSVRILRLAGIAACLLLLSAVTAAGEAENGDIQGRIISVERNFGNLNTDIAASSTKFGLGASFVFNCKGNSIEAVFSSFYSDVKEGEWLGLENTAGQLQLAINYGDANEVSGCGVDDPVTVSARRHAPSTKAQPQPPPQPQPQPQPDDGGGIVHRQR